MAYIKINEGNRITAASMTHHCGLDEIEVEISAEIWEKGIHDYKYENGEFVYEPLQNKEAVEKPSQLDIIEAQVVYTAMMTNTLMEV